MGTRGFVCFAVDGQLKTAYNHYDSYPSSLGIAILEWLRKATTNPAELRKSLQELRVISRGETPSQADIERLAPWTDLSVSDRSTQDWYCLLRKTQGHPAAIVTAGVIEDASDFPADSLFAEWGYVVDVDGDGMFEVYRGFQQQPHRQGRFASSTANSTGYYPVKLIAQWPLSSLPSDRAMIRLENQTQEEED